MPWAALRRLACQQNHLEVVRSLLEAKARAMAGTAVFVVVFCDVCQFGVYNAIHIPSGKPT